MKNPTNHTYTLAYYVQQNVPTIIKRPWWRGGSHVSYVRRWERVVLHGLTQVEADLFLAADKNKSGALYRLFMMLMAGGASGTIGDVSLTRNPHSMEDYQRMG